MMPPRRCPSCGNPVTTRRCPTCTQQFDQRRGLAAARGYDAKWRHLRAYHLSAHPLCEDCGHPAAHVHHVVDIAVDPSRRLDPSNLLSLCAPCHDRRTAGAKLNGNRHIASDSSRRNRAGGFFSAMQLKEPVLG
jgi:5-methylcytosine-specific restriction protein A